MVFRFPVRRAWRYWADVPADSAQVWQHIRSLGLAQRARLQLLDEILGDLSQAASDRLEGLNELLEDDAGTVRDFEEPIYLRLPPDDVTTDASG